MVYQPEINFAKIVSLPPTKMTLEEMSPLKGPFGGLQVVISGRALVMA